MIYRYIDIIIKFFIVILFAIIVQEFSEYRKTVQIFNTNCNEIKMQVEEIQTLNNEYVFKVDSLTNVIIQTNNELETTNKNINSINSQINKFRKLSIFF